MIYLMAILMILAAVVAPLSLGAAAIDVEEIGSFHIGGRPVTLSGLSRRQLAFTVGAPPLLVDPNGDLEVEQMYVHYARLARPKAKYPLLMWHGGGLTGVTWETTPDGRPGWQMFFLRAGHSVYVSDAVERGRASWARYPEIFKTEPFFRGSGTPDPAKAEVKKLRDIPHLFLWGDYLDKHGFWMPLRGNLMKYREALASVGVTADWIELPERGIKGNTHMLMMDRNSDQVATIVQDWLAKQGLMK